MNDIIKAIEDAQLKEVADFRVGDTVKVYAKVIEGSRERIQVYEGTVLKRQNGGARHSQLESSLTALVLRRPGRFILRSLIRLRLYVKVKLDVRNCSIFVTE